VIILSTGSLYNYGLTRVFDLASETGYEGLEVLVDGRWDSRDPGYLHRLSSDSGLPIVALHSPFVPDVQGWPPDQLGRLERTVLLAQELAVPIVVSHLPLRFPGFAGQMDLFGRHRRFLLPIPWPSRSSYYRYLLKGRMKEMERSSGVMVGLENMPIRRFLGFAINLYWFNHVEQLAGFPHLTLDTTHIGTWGTNPIAVYERLKRHVIHVHLSNFDGREHRSPPDGNLPLGDLLRSLAHDGYRGAVSVESSPDALDAQDERRCRAALKRALDFCREHQRIAPG
jgi:sugar phosphate isomerase/epimerase